MTVLREQSRPDLDVAILYRGEASVDVLLLRVGFDTRQRAIQERRIGLVLPVVFECVKVGLRCDCHDRKYADARKWGETVTRVDRARESHSRKPSAPPGVSDRIDDTPDFTRIYATVTLSVSYTHLRAHETPEH